MCFSPSGMKANFFFLLQVVCGTNKLEKLHGKVREMLQNFSRPIPGDCSFLSSESYKTTAEEKACSPNKDVKDEGEKKMLLVHAHLPANTPAKVCFFVMVRPYP